MDQSGKPAPLCILSICHSLPTSSAASQCAIPPWLSPVPFPLLSQHSLLLREEVRAVRRQVCTSGKCPALSAPRCQSDAPLPMQATVPSLPWTGWHWHVPHHGGVHGASLQIGIETRRVVSEQRGRRRACIAWSHLQLPEWRCALSQ